MSPKITGILILILATAMECFAQMALKVGSSGGPRILSPRYRDLANRFRISASAASWIALGALFFILQILMWTWVLQRLNVSVAFPMGSLCFVGVALLSRMFLGEAVGPLRWLGVAFILTGTVLVAL